MSTPEELETFRKYNWDSNEAWMAYLQKIEVPAGRDDAMVRLKAKWYQKNVDASFDAEAYLAKNAPRKGEPVDTSTSKPAPKPAPNSQSATGSQSQGSASTRSTTPRSTAASQQSMLFGLHIALLLLAVVHLVPIVPRLSWRAYTWFLRVAMFTHGFKVYIKFGMPKLNLTALKAYAQSTFPTTDLQYMMIALLFTTAPPLALVMVPFVNVAVYHAAAYASSHFSSHPLWQRYGAKAHQWLRERQGYALQMNALAEIAVGFMLIFMLITPSRSILSTYLYWNLLRLRYWSTDSATYHRQVWQILDTKSAWIRAKVPISNTGIGYVSRWFNSVR